MVTIATIRSDDTSCVITLRVLTLTIWLNSMNLKKTLHSLYSIFQCFQKYLISANSNKCSSWIKMGCHGNKG